MDFVVESAAMDFVADSAEYLNLSPVPQEDSAADLDRFPFPAQEVLSAPDLSPFRVLVLRVRLEERRDHFPAPEPSDPR